MRPQPCGGGLQGLVIDVRQDDRGSRLGERLCGGQSHARAGASDQRDLAGEVIAGVHRVSRCGGWCGVQPAWASTVAGMAPFMSAMRLEASPSSRPMITMPV